PKTLASWWMSPGRSILLPTKLGITVWPARPMRLAGRPSQRQRPGLVPLISVTDTVYSMASQAGLARPSLSQDKAIVISSTEKNDKEQVLQPYCCPTYLTGTASSRHPGPPY